MYCFGPASCWPLLTAVYTAFLFAQAKGRDLWQNPLFSMHLLAHAVLGAGAVAAGRSLSSGRHPHRVGNDIGDRTGVQPDRPAAECCTVPPTDDSRRAIHMILGKPMGGWFWGAGVVAGHVVPLLLLALGSRPLMHWPPCWRLPAWA